MKRLIFCFLAGAFFMLAGCGDSWGGIPDVDHWQKKLTDAKTDEEKKEATEALRGLEKHYSKLVLEADRREQSLNQLRLLKSPGTIPSLLKVWEQDAASRQTIAGILGMIGEANPEASQSAGQPLLSFLKEVPKDAPVSEKNAQNRMNASIITALGKMKYKPGAKELVKFLSSEDAQVASASAEALGSIDDKDSQADAVKGMLAIIKNEGQNWQSAKKIAMTALGDMRVQGAIPDLIFNLWSAKGAYYQAASQALFKIGDPSVQPLIDTLQGKNKEVEKFAKEQNFKPGSVQAKAAEVLGDLENPLAGPPLIGLIQELTDKMKKGGTIDLVEGRAIGIAAFAIGMSRDEASAPKLAALSMEHRDQPAVYAQFALALTILGAKSALDDLWKVAEDDKMEFMSWDSRLKAVTAISRLAGGDAAGRMKSLSSGLANQAIGASKGQIKSAADIKKWRDEAVEKNQKIAKVTTKKEEREALAKELEEVRDVFVMVGLYLETLDAIKRLDAKNKCKSDVKCWDGELKEGGDAAVQDAAAWELGRTKNADAVDVLFRRLKETTEAYGKTKDQKVKNELNYTRQSIFFGLRNLANDPAVAKAKLATYKGAMDWETINKQSTEELYQVAKKKAA